MEYGLKEFFGAAAVIFAVANYIPYLIGTIRHTITPHIFTWALWFLLTSTAFYAQFTHGAGMGAWATGVTAFIIFIVALLSLRNGFSYVRPFDWVALIAAVSAILLWVVTSNPLWSVILISVIHTICFLPTFRKGYTKPYQESIAAFTLTVLKYCCAIIALDTYSIITFLFPATVMCTSFLFVTMLFYRRTFS